MPAPPAPSLPDLAVYDSEMSFSNNNPAPGEWISVIVPVHNIGSVNATNVNLKMFKNGKWDGTGFFPRIPAGAAYNTSIPWYGSSSGVYELSLLVDSSYTINESNEDNNWARKNISVG